MSQKGALPLLILFFIAALAAAVGLFLLANYAKLPRPVENALRPFKKIDIPLTADYKNPLDKSSQYTNPFSNYKNPFDFLK